MTETTTMDQQEQIARIERSQEEVRKFVAEQHKLTAEARKLTRDAALAPWQLVVTAMAAGGALFGAGAAFMKLLGP
jgi:pyridoxal biosynthesis lyase PdxS